MDYNIFMVSQPQTAQKKRSWPIYAITLLLFGQAFLTAYIGGRVWQDRTWDLSRDWETVLLYIATLWGQPPSPTAAQPDTVSALEFLLFLPLAPIIVINALGFFLLRPLGWMTAMMTQGVVLAICLDQYLRTEKFFIYPLMVYAILMVLYLNTLHVRITFHASTAQLNLDNQDGT